MIRILFRWVFLALTLFAIPHLVSGVRVDDWGAALAAAAILTLLNTVVRPVLLFLTFPLTLLTLGFFILVINALLFQLAGGLVSGFQVNSFTSAFLGSLVVSLVSWLFDVSNGTQRIAVQTWRPEGRPGNEKRVDGSIDLHKDDSGKWE